MCRLSAWTAPVVLLCGSLCLPSFDVDARGSNVLIYVQNPRLSKAEVVMV
jgi:hypothetical protein